MGEVAAAALFGPCRHRFPPIIRFGGGEHKYKYSGIGGLDLEWRKKKMITMTEKERRTKKKQRCRGGGGDASADAGHSPNYDSDDSKKKKQHPSLVTFSSNISTNLPLYETPEEEASFDEYLNDRPRIFRAMFPDRRRSKRLSDEEWSIEMLPIQFLFASVSPVVVMRVTCKSHGEGHTYPPHIPPHITRSLELQATRWELHGLDGIYMPSHFDLTVQGTLYSDRRGSPRRSRLKGNLEISITLLLPSVLALVPMDVLKGAADSVLERLVERMRQEVNVNLLSDFGDFRREKLIKKHAKVIQSPPKTDSVFPNNQGGGGGGSP